jgi:pimeloyl-ACP methyl ester carboxylesterase
MDNGRWSQVEIGGKLADVFEPAQPHPQGRVVLHLHGHGLTTLKDNPVFSREFDRHGLRAICPHGQRSWWGYRICREFDPAISPEDYLLKQVLPFLAERWDARPPAIALTGNSMGGQGALRLAYRHPREFPIVAAIAPAIDFQNWHGRGLPLDEMYRTAESARQDTATLELHPLNWPRHQLIVCDPLDAEWFEGVERLTSKLSSTGIPYEADLTTSHGGHSWEYVNFMAPRVVEFVARSLDAEASRLA